MCVGVDIQRIVSVGLRVMLLPGKGHATVRYDTDYEYHRGTNYEYEVLHVH